MAKKKLSPKELREQQKTQRMAKYREAAQTKEIIDSVEKTPAQEPFKTEAQPTVEKKGKVKNRTKAAGLKSVFVTNGKVVMTSFDKQNEPKIEKILGSDNSVQSLQEPEAFAVTNVTNTNINISSSKVKKLSAEAANPAYIPKNERKIGQDVIGIKSAVEKQIFGREYPDDNLYVQIAYNILDIEKQLAIHSNNIVYAVNNLMRSGTAAKDIIGTMGYRKSYEVFKLSRNYPDFQEFLKQPQLSYFGDAFYVRVNKKNPKTGKTVTEYKLRCEEDIYNILATLGEVRQFCAHASNTNLFSLNHKSSKMDSAAAKSEATVILDKMYNSRINSIDRSFLKTNKSANFYILFNVFNCDSLEQRKTLVQKFYDYTVKKDHKHLGVSIKKLREKAFENDDYKALKSTELDSVRGKLYNLIDFVIYNYLKYSEGVAHTENMINELRAVAGLNDEREQAKEKIYATYAAKMGADLKSKIFKLLELVKKISSGSKEEGIKSMAVDTKDYEELISKISVARDTVTFCKIINLLTYFINGKEINDLLTGLINKFKNIAGFVKVIKDENLLGSKAVFPEDGAYNIFNKSDEVVTSLELINSVARMQKPLDLAKRVMYLEAAQILGVDNKSEEALLKEIDEILDTKNSKRGDPSKNFRNFIASNVIESSRFKYIIKYGDPKKLKDIIKNEKIVEFVLKGIPKTQLYRYYKSCKCVDPKNSYVSAEEDVTEQQMVSYLIPILLRLNFNYFENVNQKANVKDTESFNHKKAADAKDKMEKQAIITLYLTVLYLVLKNLVNVNSRYFLAFHCLERDSAFLNVPLNKTISNGETTLADKYAGCRELSARYIQSVFAEKERRMGIMRANGKNNLRVNLNTVRNAHLLKANMEQLDTAVISFYRNSVEHLNAVRGLYCIEKISSITSYFELYHFIMQCGLKQYICDFKGINTANAELTIKQNNADKPTQLTRPFNMGRMQELFTALNTYNSYSKDFLKALNTPFGYNFVRYKNLSIAELFDMNVQSNVPIK